MWVYILNCFISVKLKAWRVYEFSFRLLLISGVNCSQHTFFSQHWLRTRVRLFRNFSLKSFTLNYSCFNNELFQEFHNWEHTFKSISSTCYYYKIIILIVTNWTIIDVIVFGSRLVMHMQTNLLRKVIWSELQRIYWQLIKCMTLWGCSKTTKCTVKLVLLPSAGFLQMILLLLRWGFLNNKVNYWNIRLNLSTDPSMYQSKIGFNKSNSVTP